MEKDDSNNIKNYGRSASYLCFHVIVVNNKKKVICKYCGVKREPVPDRMCKHILKCSKSHEIPFVIVKEIQEETDRRSLLKDGRRSVYNQTELLSDMKTAISSSSYHLDYM